MVLPMEQLGTVLQSLLAQANGINVTMGVALHEPVVSFVITFLGCLNPRHRMAIGASKSSCPSGHAARHARRRLDLNQGGRFIAWPRHIAPG